MPDYYGSAAGFTTYHTARGRDVSAFDASEVAASLLVASEWLDARWRGSFPGLKVGLRAQVREWPRSGGQDIYGYAIASNSVPTEIENATYEAAWRDAQKPGALSIDYTPNKYRRASVDGAVSVEYTQFASAADAQTDFAIVGEILAPILSGCSGSALSGSVARV